MSHADIPSVWWGKAPDEPPALRFGAPRPVRGDARLTGDTNWLTAARTRRLPFPGNGDSLGPVRFLTHMKITDDYKAKYRLWAANPRVVPASAPVRIPHFKSRRFSTHAEMTAWKSSVLRQLAQAAPGK